MMDNYSGLRTNLTMLMDFYEITMANGYFIPNFVTPVKKAKRIYLSMVFMTE